MLKTKVLLLAWLLACALLPLLPGCAARMPQLPDVGVVAPRPQIPPVPALVQQTSPKPTGFFHRSLLS